RRKPRAFRPGQGKARGFHRSYKIDTGLTNFSGVSAMNQPRQGHRNGPVAAFFIFVWDAMNFVRRLAFNLLFFGLLLVLLVAMAAAGRVTPLQDGTTLVIA